MPPTSLSIQADLPIGVTEIALDETASTNGHALDLLKSGAAPHHLTLVWARRQSMGRGRSGRVWQSLEGNAFISMILRPQPDWGALTHLPLVVAVAVHAAIRPHVPRSRSVTLKWPNDVLVDGAKVCGTLIESHRVIRGSTADRWSAEALVVGIGVNVAHSPDTGLIYPATSLRAAGSAVKRDRIVCDVAAALVASIETWRAHGFAPIRSAYLERAHALGEGIAVRTSPGSDESLSGVFEGIDEDGALLLRLASGTVKRLVAGDVSFAAPGAEGV